MTDVGLSPITIALQGGYNLITFNQLISVSPGYIPYFTFQSTRIATSDPNESPLVSDFVSDSSGLRPLLASQNVRFYVRAIVSPSLKGIGVFHAYTSAGTYTVTATVSSSLLGTSASVTQSVTITPLAAAIANLTLATTYGSPVCYLNVSCTFQASAAVGNPTAYVFTVGTSMTSTNQSVFSYTFTSPGNYSVTVTAMNAISNASYTLTISVSNNQMFGLSFKAGTAPQSASIVGQLANFLFMILVGVNYQCAIVFGDNSPTTTISDAVFYINNTFVGHTYSSEGVYTVRITCSNPSSNSLNLTFSHYVQYPLVGLALSTNGTTLNTPYQIGFSVQSGSAPYDLAFFYDNVLDSGVVYSNVSGKASARPAESTPTTHYVFINMTNYVSSVQLNGTFQISSPLQNVQFAVTPTTGISAYTYVYPITLSLTTTMTSGSNVLITIAADSGNPTASTLPNNTVSVQTQGTWVNPNVIAYAYANPGAYTMRANVSNALVSYAFTQSIKIISTVDDLIPNLITNSNKVVFQSFDGGVTGSGLAQFVFNYAANTKAGSDAYVTFWPGDSANATYGPFALNMDFNANVSRSPLQFTYTALGTYTAVFYVTNPLGTKSFTFTISVVYSLMGFYVDVSPGFTQVGVPVNVNAYLIQGNNVQYQWLADGAQFTSSSSRTCKHHSFRECFMFGCLFMSRCFNIYLIM